MIFEQSLPCMSQTSIELLLNIANCYTSLEGTFIKMYNMEKDLHVLSRFSTDKLVMQEVSYHISIGLSAGLHKKKKAPWLTLPMQIGFYTIKSLKEPDVEVNDFKNFKFGTKSFNPYDPHGLCRDHYARLYYPQIHEVCHWL